MGEENKQDLTGDGLGDATGAASGAASEAESAAAAEAASEAGEQAAAGEGNAELAQARAEIAELRDRLARTQAEFENYRRRMAREKEELILYANQKLLLKLLPVLDNLERALNAPKAEGDDKLRQGVELTARSFRDVLAGEGLSAIEAKGQPFNPNLHEAVATVESDDYEDGVIVNEFQTGYKLGDRVIRPSMVQVNKKG